MTEPMDVAVKRIGTHDLPLPKYETDGASGFDLRACFYRSGVDSVVLEPGASIIIPVGFAFACPVGYEVQVRGRSGLAFKHDVVAIHSPGTVDADYRGEVHVKLWNLGDEDAVINHRERVAQGVIAPIVRGVFREVDELSPTARGDGGFGSTGRK